MKILLVSLHLVEYAVELANALGERNQIHLVMSKHRVDQTIGERLHWKVTDKVSYTLLTKHSWWSLSTWKSIYYVIKILATSRYDVVHLQECSNNLNLLFLLFSFKPVVITVHDVMMHPGSYIKPWKLWWRSKTLKYGYDKIIVHGEKLKKDLLYYYKKPAQAVFAVPHGCLLSFLDGRNPDVSEEPYTILFFGRIEQYKGLKYLLESEPLISKVIPEFKVIIAGRGDDLETYKSAILSSTHFEVHNRFIPNKEVPSFFQRASLIVLPYTEASQSGVVAMAFAFGKPVIATDVGSLSEVVHDGRVGILVPPRNAEKLAEAIIDLLKNKEKRIEMGREALKLARTTLSWQHIASLTEAVYQKKVTS